MEITTGAEARPTEEEGPLNEPARTNAVSGQKSIRAISSFAEAAPGNVTVALSLSTSAVLRWEDRASDEDGYLVEVSAEPEKDFKICALLPPNTSPHDFQLSVKTRQRIEAADLVVLNGLGLDSWVEPALARDRQPIVRVSAGLGSGSSPCRARSTCKRSR